MTSRGVSDLSKSENNSYSQFVQGQSRSFKMKTAIQILSILMEDGMANRHALAKKAALDGVVLARYLDILLMLDWVRPVFEDHDYVAVTERAREFVNDLMQRKP